MMSLEAISEALTHSDQSIIKIYINTKNTVKQTAEETAFRIVKKRWGKFQGNFQGNFGFLDEKKHPRDDSWMSWNVDIIVLINVLKIVKLYELS